MSRKPPCPGINSIEDKEETNYCCDNNKLKRKSKSKNKNDKKRRRITRFSKRRNAHPTVKVEDFLNGIINCPHPGCKNGLTVSEKGCAIITCRANVPGGHTNTFFHFCMHCRKECHGGDYCNNATCSQRNTREDRIRSQKARNAEAQANPIIINDDDDDYDHDDDDDDDYDHDDDDDDHEDDDDDDHDESLQVEEPVQEKRGNHNQKTGLIGVHKNGKKYRALIRYDGTQHYIGSFDTKEQAGIAYDRVAIDKSTEMVSFTLNYPNMSDLEREEALPKKRGRRNPNQKTGLIGVCKKGEKYKAQIGYGGIQHYLGTFDTKEKAGIAYDRFAIDKSTEMFSFTLNYPNMSDLERDESLTKKRRRGNPNQKTGLIGVCKKGEKYRADICYDGTRHNLGTFDTKEQAGMAYDRFVVAKSTEEVSFTLNYPNLLVYGYGYCSGSRYGKVEVIPVKISDKDNDKHLHEEEGDCNNLRRKVAKWNANAKKK